MWVGRIEPCVPIPRNLDGLSLGLCNRIVRHLHRCPLLFFLRWGNMATPAAVNPSGKSVSALLVGDSAGNEEQKQGAGF